MIMNRKTKGRSFLRTEEYQIAVDTLAYLEKKHGGDTMNFKKYPVKEVSDAIGVSQKKIWKSLEPLLTEGLVRRDGKNIEYRTPDMTIYDRD